MARLRLTGFSLGDLPVPFRSQRAASASTRLEFKANRASA
jgi:hypothetical protein